MHPKILKISKENAEFQIIRALKVNREKRNQFGFLFEGVRAINNAIANNWKITTFIYSPERGVSEWGRNILKASKAEKHIDLSENLMQQLSDREETSELMAIAQIPKDDLSRIPLKKNPLIVIFDRPGNPGNLGTIVRTCDALGVDGLVVTGHAADLYDPEAVRATTGSLFSYPIVRQPSQAAIMPWIEELKAKYPNLQIVGTDEKGEKTIYDVDFKKPTIILAGNEKAGLSTGYRELATTLAQIPMAGTGSASSLNVAVATSIVIAEAKRQRGL